MRRAALLLPLLPLVAACGFHLAGSRVPALDDVAVVYEQPYRVVPPPLIDALEARLGSPGESAASNRLIISEIDTVRRVLAVSPEDARATAYEITTTVRFDFRADGQMRLSGQTLSARREQSFDSTERLAAEAERRELMAAMQEELADLIVLRLETALDSPE